MSDKPIINNTFDGLNFGEFTVDQAYAEEARASLKSNRFLNIYGPRRHGKTSLGSLLLRSDCGAASDAVMCNELPNALVGNLKNERFGTRIAFQHYAFLMLRDFGVSYQQIEQASPEALAFDAAGFISSYQDKLQSENGSRRLSFCVDEMSMALYDSNFQSFMSTFCNATQSNTDFTFIAITHYPMAAYPWKYSRPIFPDVMVSPWDMETSSQLYCAVKDGASIHKAESAFDQLGGCPTFMALNAYGVLSNQVINMHRDGVRKMLGQVHPDEQADVLQMLNDVLIGVVEPATHAECAAALHLILAGLARQEDGAIKLKGKAYKPLVKKILTDSAHWFSTEHTVRLIPFVAERPNIVCSQPIGKVVVAEALKNEGLK